MRSFHEDGGPIYTFLSGTLALVNASELSEGIDGGKAFLLVLALPVPELRCWCLRSRGRYVGSRSRYNNGEEGDLVEFVSACGMAMPVTLDARRIEWTSH